MLKKVVVKGGVAAFILCFCLQFSVNGQVSQNKKPQYQKACWVTDVNNRECSLIGDFDNDGQDDEVFLVERAGNAKDRALMYVMATGKIYFVKGNGKFGHIFGWRVMTDSPDPQWIIL